MNKSSALEENLRNLSLSYKFQCEENWESSWECLKKSWEVLYKFIVLADNQPQIQQILNQEREILPNVIIQNYENSVYDEISFKLPTVKVSKNKTLKKSLWSKEETDKLMEALEIYGRKDFKNIASFIGTRNVSQIRSKLQKMEMRRLK